MRMNGVWQMQHRLLQRAVTSNRVPSGTAMRVFVMSLASGSGITEPSNPPCNPVMGLLLLAAYTTFHQPASGERAYSLRWGVDARARRLSVYEHTTCADAAFSAVLLVATALPLPAR